MEKLAIETLGISWDTEANTVDTGRDYRELLSDYAGTQATEALKTDIEAHRERPISGDREAESDWKCFCADARDAAAKVAAAASGWGMNLASDREMSPYCGV